MAATTITATVTNAKDREIPARYSRYGTWKYSDAQSTQGITALAADGTKIWFKRPVDAVRLEPGDEILVRGSVDDGKPGIVFLSRVKLLAVIDGDGALYAAPTPKPPAPTTIKCASCDAEMPYAIAFFDASGQGFCPDDHACMVRRRAARIAKYGINPAKLAEIRAANAEAAGLTAWQEAR